MWLVWVTAENGHIYVRGCNVSGMTLNDLKIMVTKAAETHNATIAYLWAGEPDLTEIANTIAAGESVLRSNPYTVQTIFDTREVVQANNN